MYMKYIIKVILASLLDGDLYFHSLTFTGGITNVFLKVGARKKTRNLKWILLFDLFLTLTDFE